MLQLGYSSEFYSANRIVYPQGMRAGHAKGEAPMYLGSLFLYVLSSPPLPALCKLGLARKGAYLFHLRFSLWSADFLLFHFHGLFHLSFSHRHLGLLFPIQIT